ncbi:hypothetical protein LTR53_006051 [Teratosphaeriaceae sp. CCFEE 6253]|nr:hypothetical protein LTR53_006051 [Teratosphaeriaceae sp. CCFEE 6253]
MDLQSVRSLAHKIYCQCNESSSAFRPLSRYVRTLRNKLEDADDTLGDMNFRPEVIRILEAAAESRNVLNRLDKTLQQCRRAQPLEEDVEEGLVVGFVEHILMVTHLLQTALDEWEKLDGDTDRVMAGVPRDRQNNPAMRSPSDRSARDGHEQPGTASPSVRSSSPGYSATSDWRSSTSGAMTTPGSSRWREPDLVAADAPPGSDTVHARPLNTSMGRWKAPFSVADPMSSAIEKASSMILSSEGNACLPDHRMSTLGAIRVVAPLLTATTFGNGVASDADRGPLPADMVMPVQRASHDQSTRSAPTTVGNQARSGPIALPDTIAMSTAPYLSHEGGPDVQVSQEQKSESKGSPMRQMPGRLDNQASHAERLDVDSTVGAASAQRSSPVQAVPLQSYRSSRGEASPPESSEPYMIAEVETLAKAGYNAEFSAAQESSTSHEEVATADSQRGLRTHALQRYRIANPDLADSLALGRQRGIKDLQQRVSGLEDSNHRGPLATMTKPSAEPRALSTSPQGVTSAEVATVLEPSAKKASIVAYADGLHPNESQSTSQHANTDVEKIPVECSPETRSRTAVEAWNAGRWDDAESEVGSLLAASRDRDMARRMLHLLGVISSLRGEWEQALASFLSVLTLPLTEVSEIDAGDCAAAYWLGDTYSLLGRRAEALLAYTIAEQGPLFQRSATSGRQLLRCIKAEQAACQLGGSGPDLKAQWDREAHIVDRSAKHSILNARVITASAASAIIARLAQQRVRDPDMTLPLEASQSRAMVFMNLGGESGSWLGKHRLKITQSAFEPSGAWPVAFDPCFAMANVARGRVLSHECDLLQVMTSNPAAKLPKLGPLDRSRRDCFTCQDLGWAVTTIRACLTRLHMDWYEVASVAGASLNARYPYTAEGVATVHFFTIALFRLSLRPGYGVDVCSDGLCSARIMRSESGFDKGVHREEAKRVRLLIRRYLDAAARHQEAIDMRDTALPVMSINGGMYRKASVKDQRLRTVHVASPSSSKAGSLFSRMS